MNVSFTRAPHTGQPAAPVPQASNAALLIDFDNVTMGIRSDITKELKNLLNSAVIKGKVAVQRAYADWRRYPQYVVPLAEASVDLIFAPAYGSSKKNATDIRLSIDALELVFIRPEIGVFILLSGDSDFSSLVLKLKEYGKYVIGVGIRESASDLLVQNCDEYYSYSALTGLTRAGDEGPPVSRDPWELVEAAVRQMTADRDVMRSDRLKQVLLDLDPNFDEKNLGFSKFNRFVADAASRGVIRLHKLENGQYEIALPAAGEAPPPQPAESRRGRGRRRERPAPDAAKKVEADTPAADSAKAKASEPAAESQPARKADATEADRLHAAYDLLRKAATELGATTEKAVRDSDVKRRILDFDPDWDESALGFSKFSRFLRQAHDAEAINLHKLESGIYELTLPGEGARMQSAEKAAPAKAQRERPDRQRDKEAADRGQARAEAPPPAPPTDAAVASAPTEGAKGPKTDAAPEAVKAETPAPRAPAHSIGLRRGSRGRLLTEPPPLLEGQTVRSTPKPVPAAVEGPAPAKHVAPRATKKGPAGRTRTKRPAASKAVAFDARPLGLPTAAEDIIQHIRAYRGIGPKSADAFVEAVGPENVFATLRSSPDRVREILGAKRGETLIEAWQDDYAFRLANMTAGGATGPAMTERAARRPATAGKSSAARPASSKPTGSRPRTRRGGRRRTKKKPTESSD